MAHSIKYDKITAFSVTVHLEGLDDEYSKNDRHIRWSIYDEDGEFISKTPFEDLSGKISKTPSVTFYDLIPNTRYEIYYYIYPDGYAWEANGDDYFRTNRIRPSIWDIITSYGKEDVRIYWDCEEHTSGVYYEIYARQRDTSEWYLKETLSSPPRRYTSIAVNKYNVNYEVKIIAFYDDEEQGSDTERFLVPPISPGPWTWTNAEWEALTNKGKMKTITVDRWNSFISWLNDVIGYRAALDGQDYAQIPSSAKAKSDKILYARDWNAINYYSRAITEYSYFSVESGDIIYGSYITELTDIMNALI